MKYQAVLFDWGGTLVDVAGQSDAFLAGSEAVIQRLGSSAADIAPAELVRAVLEAEADAARDPDHREADQYEVVKQWAAAKGLKSEPALIRSACEELGKSWVGSLEVIDGALEAVAKLHAAGLRIGLVSNCCVPPVFCCQELARQGLADYMHFTVFSSEVGYRKPSDRIFEAAFEKLYPDGQQRDLSRVVFVGDAPRLDVQAAAALGMRTALVNRPAGSWPAEDYAQARPDWRINRVAELPELLGI